MENLPENLVGAELERYNAHVPDEEKPGYLLYRQTNAHNQRWRTVPKWAKLGADEKQPFIDQATGSHGHDNNANAGDEAGDGGFQGDTEEAGYRNSNERSRQGRWSDSGSRKFSTIDVRDDVPTPKSPSMADESEQGEPVEVQNYEPSTDEENLTQVQLAPPEGRHWRWAKTVYDTRRPDQGSRDCVIVSLWIQVDEEGNIWDRVAVKMVRALNTSNAYFLLEEADLMRRFPECHSLLTLRAYTRPKPAETPDFRLYTDYAAHGSLADLLEQYQKEENAGTQLPEPFLWLVFLGLAEAIFAFNTGRCATAQEQADEELNAKKNPKANLWTPLFHRDIKTDNIFLGSAHAPYLAYPNPILADYDISLSLNTPHFRNNKDMYYAGGNSHGGTESWRPPETRFKSLGYDITTAGDIHASGLIIWTLMHASLGRARRFDIRRSAERSYDLNSENTLLPKVTRGPVWNASYTKPLYDLVKNCLKVNPSHRPTFLELRKRTKEEVEKIQRLMGSIKTENIGEHLRLLVKEEFFPVGSSAPANKKRKRE
ncbi:kinase-like protein [Massarina eburnea CBS 473.64]|uniref:Kinase-like protein n=1 Tax=Massarina eburnea CBS 473.64 TaxID=1395130 RepID=A0A6A6SIG1_9PLEO|nr:kinase-like protein [Massarina eburnea CBS 473.64]